MMLAVVAGGYLWRAYERRPAVTRVVTTAGEFTEEEHYSPDENLEQLDLARIDGAQHSIDIAMYAFTDKYLAEALARAAQRGVQVRIYRDRSQFEDEQRKNNGPGRDSTTGMLAGGPNIHIRVKGSRELMHLKAYLVDGKLLRDGSANWSPTGLKRQDNDARYTTDPNQVGAFGRQFEQLWSRRDNREVQ
jgi:phosphatidylserine/phosphatidylglycerophosphate/cardiolipin synthase-like enzyme